MIIAVDTGGTKTLVAAFSLEGEVLESIKFSTPQDQAAYLTATIKAIREVAPDADSIQGLSIALPGVIRDQKAVVCKNLGWYDFDILAELRQEWPNTPSWLENDANLGGVGAAQLLNPAPHRCLYITISTGIGGGFTEDGRIVSAVSENEISDIFFEYDGVMSRWGEIANGRAIMDKFGVYASEVLDPEDQREVGRRIARGLMALLPVLRPDIVAFGGGAGAHFDLFARYVESELSILPEQYRCPLVTAPHPEEIVIYGCYFHAKNQLAT